MKKQPNSPIAADTIREVEIAGDSICEDSVSTDGIKLRPGETKEQALERIKK